MELGHRYDLVSFIRSPRVREREYVLPKELTSTFVIQSCSADVVSRLPSPVPRLVSNQARHMVLSKRLDERRTPHVYPRTWGTYAVRA